jgi:hypothetical protein
MRYASQILRDDTQADQNESGAILHDANLLLKDGLRL